MNHRVYSIADFERLIPSAPGENNHRQRAWYQAILYKAIETQLTPKQREAVELYYFQGLRLREIAPLLQVDSSCISRRLSSARRRIKAFADTCCQLAPPKSEE